MAAVDVELHRHACRELFGGRELHLDRSGEVDLFRRDRGRGDSRSGCRSASGSPGRRRRSSSHRRSMPRRPRTPAARWSDASHAVTVLGRVSRMLTAVAPGASTDPAVAAATTTPFTGEVSPARVTCVRARSTGTLSASAWMRRQVLQVAQGAARLGDLRRGVLELAQPGAGLLQALGERVQDAVDLPDARVHLPMPALMAAMIPAGLPLAEGRRREAPPAGSWASSCSTACSFCTRPAGSSSPWLRALRSFRLAVVDLVDRVADLGLGVVDVGLLVVGGVDRVAEQADLGAALPACRPLLLRPGRSGRRVVDPAEGLPGGDRVADGHRHLGEPDEGAEAVRRTDRAQVRAGAARDGVPSCR